jgi:predicted GNAT superfamily acetyltransferase
MTPGPSPSDIEIRHCNTLEEFEECVRLEHITWGPELAEPTGMFVVARHTGGQVFAAYDGTKMVGFTLALVGTRAGRIFLHSHQTAVLPEYRDRGIGRSLKLFQRDDALRRGINLVEWTFDPLELKNAYFNFVRLGAVARRLIPNCYGITLSPLHSGIPTDRLVAEWWLDSARVKAILEGESSMANPIGNVVSNLTSNLISKGLTERIPLPSNIGDIKSQDPEAAIRIQAGLRGQLQKAFAKGQVATSIETRTVRTDYILEPHNQISGLYLPDLRDH